jgi:hypothetical protein
VENFFRKVGLGTQLTPLRARLLLAALRGFAIAKPFFSVCALQNVDNLSGDFEAPYVLSAKLNSAIEWMPVVACSWARFHAPRVAKLTISDTEVI